MLHILCIDGSSQHRGIPFATTPKLILYSSLRRKELLSQRGKCTAIKEAQATKQNIYSYAPKSNATADYTALVDEILGEETK